MLCLNSLDKDFAVFCLLAIETTVNMDQAKLISVQNVLINKKMEAKISRVVNAWELVLELKKKIQADGMLFPEIIRGFAMYNWKYE